MAKQLAINLVSGVCNALHAGVGMYCPSNAITPPPSEVRPDCVCGCITAHYRKIGTRNIFRGLKEPAIIVIDDKNN